MSKKRKPTKTEAVQNLQEQETALNEGTIVDPAIAAQILNPPEDPYSHLPEELREEIRKEKANQKVQPFRRMPNKLQITRGGVGTFLLDGSTQLEELTGIVIISAIKRAWYPAREVSALPPLCSSPDGNIGIFSSLNDQEQLKAGFLYPLPHPGVDIAVHQDQEFPEYFHCNGCPMSRWGTDVSGSRGKACKELRRLLFIPDGMTAPAIFTLPVTSIKNYDQYCSGLAAMGREIWLTHTRVTQTVVTGNYPHGIAEFESLGDVAEPSKVAAIIELRRMYDEYVNDGTVTASEYYGQAQAHDGHEESDTEPEPNATEASRAESVPF